MTAGIVLACLFVAAAACSAPSHTASTQEGGAAATSDTTLDFTLVNFTRSNLHAVYVSPHDSPGWEENVLGRDQLPDGDTLKIRFRPEEKAAMWDLRVEDENGNNVELKNLNLREISKLTLRRGNNVVLAEAE